MQINGGGLSSFSTCFDSSQITAGKNILIVARVKNSEKSKKDEIKFRPAFKILMNRLKSSNISYSCRSKSDLGALDSMPFYTGVNSRPLDSKAMASFTKAVNKAQKCQEIEDLNAHKLLLKKQEEERKYDAEIELEEEKKLALKQELLLKKQKAERKHAAKVDAKKAKEVASAKELSNKARKLFDALIVNCSYNFETDGNISDIIALRRYADNIDNILKQQGDMALMYLKALGILSTSKFDFLVKKAKSAANHCRK